MPTDLIPQLRIAALLLCFLTALSIAPASHAQTLARPGWTGSGMTLEPWFTHAVLYEIDPHGFRSSSSGAAGDLRDLTSQIDYIRSLGVDAIALTHFNPVEGAERFQAIDPALGTLDDFDDLLREAARDNVRVLIEVEPKEVADPAALAGVSRFWLSRGVAGIRVRGTADAAQLHALHESVRGFPGQRILVAESAIASAPGADAADLVLNPALSTLSTLDAAQLRPLLMKLSGNREPAPISITDSYGLPRSSTRFRPNGAEAATALSIDKLLATLLLTTHANAQLYFGQEIGMGDKEPSMAWGTAADTSVPASKKRPVTPAGPEVAAEEADGNSLLNWYRRLIDLHHGNPALRSGTADFLDHDADHALVWVSRKGAATPLSPAIVIACNLSGKPVTLNLEADMRGLHLRGNFLRTIARSTEGMGGQSLNSVVLPAYGVYVGELRL